MATTEDSIQQIMDEDDERNDNAWMILLRKKEKLDMQLSEALWIKKKIDRKYPKVITEHYSIH